jgi:hypothetical protein
VVERKVRKVERIPHVDNGLVNGLVNGSVVIYIPASTPESDAWPVTV